MTVRVKVKAATVGGSIDLSKPAKIVSTAVRGPVGPTGPPGSMKLLGNLTTDRVLNTQASDEVLGGTFVPTSTTYILEFRVGMGCYGSAKPTFIVAVGYKDPPGGRIIQRKVLAPPEPGVTEFRLLPEGFTGKLAVVGSEDQAQVLTRRFRVTGLTPGRTYTWQVTGGTLSSSKSSQIARNPVKPKFSPDSAEVWTASIDAKTVIPVTVGGRPYWTIGSSAGRLSADSDKWLNTVGTPIPTGHATQWPVMVAVGANRVAVAQHNFVNASSILVINRLTRAIEGTTAFPEACLVQGLVIAPNGTTAYATTNTGKVFPFTLSTRVFGAALTLGGNLRHPQIVGTGAGTRLWVPDGTNNGVYPVPLPGFTVPAIVPLGVNTVPNASALGPDGSFWACLTGTAHAGRIIQVKPDLTIGTTVFTTNQNNVAGTGAAGCSVTAPASGQPPIIYWHNGLAIGYSYTDDGAQFDKVSPFGTAIGGVEVTYDEYVFQCWDTGTVGFIGSWSAAQINIVPNAIIPTLGGTYLEVWGGAEAP